MTEINRAQRAQQRQEIKDDFKERKQDIKEEFKGRFNDLQDDFKARLQDAKAAGDGEAIDALKEEYKTAVNQLKDEFEAAKADFKGDFKAAIQDFRAEIDAAKTDTDSIEVKSDYSGVTGADATTDVPADVETQMREREDEDRRLEAQKLEVGGSIRAEDLQRQIDVGSSGLKG